MNFDIITQVRYRSSRLPGKILLNFDKSNLLTFFISNLKKIKNINRIIIACPDDGFINIFKTLSKRLKVNLFVYKGKENNVLDRYYKCAQKYSSENIIRITSDCPFINTYVIKDMINYYKKESLLFLTNNKPRFVPHGFDCEIIHNSVLKNARQNAKTKFEKEHVTPWIYKNYFKDKNNMKILKKNYSNIRVTIDTPKDYHFFLKNDKLLKKIATKKNYIEYFKKLKK